MLRYIRSSSLPTDIGGRQSWWPPKFYVLDIFLSGEMYQIAKAKNILARLAAIPASSDGLLSQTHMAKAKIGIEA